MSDVNLSISQEVVKPIIEAQIKSAIANALGKQDELIKSAINALISLKVDGEGKRNKDDYYNKHDFIEWHIKSAIETALKEAIGEWVKSNQEKIKLEFFNILKSKKGTNAMINAFMEGLTKSTQSNYSFSTSFNYK